MPDPEPTGKSILDTTKKMLGIPSTDTSFDTDIIASINSAFMSLCQIGVGPSTPFKVVDKDTMWEDFMEENLDQFGGLDTYMYFKARLAFDPPTNSFSIDAIKSQITELEERFKLQVLIISTTT